MTSRLVEIILSPGDPKERSFGSSSWKQPVLLTSIQVFERSQFKNENGAAVSIPPNGTRVLQHWGFDCDKAGGIENIQVRRPKGDTLEPMAPTLNFANAEQLYGNKWFFYHRVDMHRRLREQAEEAGSVIRLGNQVMDVDPETGVISLKDGTKVQKDLVVVADGQHVSHFLRDFARDHSH
jgi:salicylate hydroxylase